MKRFLKPKYICLYGLLVSGFIVLQIVFFVSAFNARTACQEYMGREVSSETVESFEANYYSNGTGRMKLKVPEFKTEFSMHETSFEWIENPYLPPDENTKLSEMWVGTCTLTPGSPWKHLDIFGLLGPIEIRLYGDWSARCEK